VQLAITSPDELTSDAIYSKINQKRVDPPPSNRKSVSKLSSTLNLDVSKLLPGKAPPPPSSLKKDTNDDASEEPPLSPLSSPSIQPGNTVSEFLHIIRSRARGGKRRRPPSRTISR